MTKPTCIRCEKTPEEIREYEWPAKLTGQTPTEWVLDNEAIGCWGKGSEGKFYCTDCYMKAGMPLRDEEK